MCLGVLKNREPDGGFCERQTVSGFIVDEKQRQGYNNKKECKTGRECATVENQRDFCTECRRETNYTLKKIKINQTIREKEYTFEITAAFCNECGGEMGIPGLMDYNIKEIDEQYRKASDNIGG